MSNDWFFDKFALIADAPGAVAKMRELVLDLAVRGKLMPQDPNEESAKETLKRVDAEREQLVKANRVRRQDTLGPVPIEAIPFAIPVNWQWCYLADVCFLITDGAHHTPQYLESGVPFLSVKDVSSGSIDFSSTRYISEEAHRELCKRCQPELGDVLLTKVGTTGIAVNVEDDRDFSIFVSLALLKFSQPNLDGRFLTYLINSPLVRQQSAKNTQGIGNKNLVLRLINRFIVPLPPLAEQKRIVAKVDELMGLCDALEAQQQERELRKSVLVRSSLSRFAEAPTPENLGYLFHKSYDIPPSELRKSILTLAVHGKLVPFDTEGTKQTVGEHIDFQSGFAFKSQWFTATGARLCRNVNVSHGFLDWKESVSVDEKVAHDFQRFALCEGDIVLSLDRPLIATGLKIARVRQEDLPSLLLQRVARLTPKHEQLSRSYIFLWLNSTAFVDCIDPGRSNGVPHISTRQVQQLAFSVPPLAEQHRIVAKVDQLMSLVDELERQQDESRKKASNLLDAIVQEMTSGG